MACWIDYRIKANPLVEVEWHTGEKWPVPRGFELTQLEVSAEGDELAWIYRHFPDLPKTSGGSVTVFPRPWSDLISLNMPIILGTRY